MMMVMMMKSQHENIMVCPIISGDHNKPICNAPDASVTDPEALLFIFLA